MQNPNTDNLQVFIVSNTDNLQLFIGSWYFIRGELYPKYSRKSKQKRLKDSRLSVKIKILS